MTHSVQAPRPSLLSDPWGGWDDEADSNWLISFVDILSLTLALLVLIIGNLLIKHGTLPVKAEAPAVVAAAAPAVVATPAPAPAAVSVAQPGVTVPRPVLDASSPSAAVSVQTEIPPAAAATRPEPPQAAEGTQIGAPGPIARIDASLFASSGMAEATAAPLLIGAIPVTGRSDWTVAARAAAEPAPADRLVGAVRERLGDLVKAVRSGGGVSLEIGEAVLFRSARAELLPEAQPVIEHLAQTLRAAGPVTIAVEGHSDDRPIRGGRFASNWELSSARAGAVTRELIAAGLPAAQLRSVGYADTHPVADNKSAQGRAKNRRVNLLVEFPVQAGATVRP